MCLLATGILKIKLFSFTHLKYRQGILLNIPFISEHVLELVNEVAWIYSLLAYPYILYGGLYYYLFIYLLLLFFDSLSSNSLVTLLRRLAKKKT